MKTVTLSQQETALMIEALAELKDTLRRDTNGKVLAPQEMTENRRMNLARVETLLVVLKS